MKQDIRFKTKVNVYIMLVLVMVFALCACGTEKNGEVQSGGSTTETNQKKEADSSDGLMETDVKCVSAGFFMENRDENIWIFTSTEDFEDYYEWVQESLTKEREDATNEDSSDESVTDEEDINEIMLDVKSVFTEYDDDFFKNCNLILNQFKTSPITKIQVESIETEENSLEITIDFFGTRDFSNINNLQNVLVAVDKDYSIDSPDDVDFDYVEIYLSDEEMERRFGEGADTVDYGNEIEFDVKYESVSVDFYGNYHDAMIVRSVEDLVAYYSWAEAIWVEGYLSNDYVIERYTQEEWVGDKMIGMKECFVDYDDSFFEDKILLLKYESPGSGSVDFEVEKVLWGENNGENTLEIVTKASSPECMTSDDPIWYIYIEIDKEFDVQEKNIIDTEERIYYIEDEGYFKRNG